MALLAGVRKSFADGERLLQQLAGWSIDDDSLRRLTHREAPKISAHYLREFDPGIAAGEGDWELQIDGGMVPTQSTFREVKVAVLLRRKQGATASASEWNKRKLPAANASFTFARLAFCGDFMDRCTNQLTRLGWNNDQPLYVLSDGANWIGGRTHHAFPHARQLLDIFHASEQIAKSARGLFGEGAPAAQHWLESTRLQLLADGWHGLGHALGDLLTEANTPARHAVKDQLISYFEKQSERLNYAHRLHTGRAIGSGAVEGAIKQQLKGRLRQTGAQWCDAHVEPFFHLICFAKSPQWQQYFLTA